MGVKEGEYLAYSVSVNQYADDEEDVPDPQAASSEGPAAAEHGQEEGCGGTSGARAMEHVEPGGGDDAMLPITGEKAPSMWAEEDYSNIRDFSVDDFMETPLAAKFFLAWTQGQVTDNLIGRRFGYGVLGRFYGKRDWQNGIFDTAEQDAAVEIEGESGVVPANASPSSHGAEEPCPLATVVEGPSGAEFVCGAE